VASQLQHHGVVNDKADRSYDLQIVNPEIDLLQPRFTAHGRFSCNLHIVLVHADRWRETSPDVWGAVRTMIRKASTAKGHLLSGVGILPDHLHLALGIPLD